MAKPTTRKQPVSSGIEKLDRLLGGLFIGDNVIWYDDAGSLASAFCLNFAQTCRSENQPIIYATFDRSPRNLLEKLGPLAEYPGLTILDCFTWGKGAGSDVFLRFYYEDRPEWPCRIVRVDDPRHPNQVMDALYGVHASLTGEVRFVFESMTGMQELWGGEEELLHFYSHSCPRLYELNTIAYWIMEKDAHSPRQKAQINQIAQVAIDLSIKRGTTSLTILKAEKRSLDNQHKPFTYWTKDLEINIEDEAGASGRIELGRRLKEIRTKRGFSQTELARLVGVTPSTISQVESSLIFPSIPALLKMAEVLSVNVSSFFQAKTDMSKKLVFPASDATEIRFPDLNSEGLFAKALTPVDLETRAEPFLLEIAPNTKLPSHFFVYKGAELGYVIAGRITMSIDKEGYSLGPGDVVYLESDIPTQWHNEGPAVAKLLWIRVK
ncbi:MAG: helix-turn-helix domain-containing protein [Desulfomonilaceae bacterium]|nr:helix-turn-helix domain-containing protein [Desulfomonilaceae bacterium]